VDRKLRSSRLCKSNDVLNVLVVKLTKGYEAICKAREKYKRIGYVFRFAPNAHGVSFSMS
jgi:hypothetical protein